MNIYRQMQLACNIRHTSCILLCCCCCCGNQDNASNCPQSCCTACNSANLHSWFQPSSGGSSSGSRNHNTQRI